MQTAESTASAVISHMEKLEENSAKFYQQLSEKYTQGKKMFLQFAQECRRNKLQVTRTYQETITDALEAGFTFKRLDLNKHKVETTLPDEASYRQALETAIQLEARAGELYREAAEASESLLATIPMALRRIAQDRDQRRLKLQSMLGGK